MRYASCSHEGRDFAAAVDGDQVFPLSGLDELGRETGADVLAAVEPAADGIPLAAVTLRPVIPAPGKIICVGLNYLAHVGETGRDIPEYPVLFTKFAATLAGPFERVPLPPESDQVDYEGELAVVIGRTGRRIPIETALDHVGGYTVADDVTMRDYQYKTNQWLQGKAWERSTPLGPFLVTPDEVGDPGALDLRVTVNGERMQAASTAQLMFDVSTLISRVSEFVSLEPGDVLLTGTPGGVGFRRDPQVFIRPGDRVVVEIDGVGRIENEFFAEDPAAT
jgi:acylpyruvate hydrolase